MFAMLLAAAIGQPPNPFTVRPAAVSQFSVKAGRTASAVAWYKGSEYAEALKERDRTRKPVLVLFTDPVKCVPCRQLEAGALKDNWVCEVLTGFVCVRVDVTSSYGRQLVAAFGAKSTPTMMVYRDGVQVGTMTGDVCPAGLVEFLKEPTKTRATPPPPKTVKFKTSVVGYNSTHNCPSCGKYQNVVGSFRGDGTHTHTCPSDGTTWYH